MDPVARGRVKGAMVAIWQDIRGRALVVGVGAWLIGFLAGWLL